MKPKTRPDADGLRIALGIVESEEEPDPVEMPPAIIERVLAGDTVYVANAMVACVRATKNSIARRIRGIINEA